MQKAVQAIYFHYWSSDNQPMHHNCPVTDESWCFYNRALAKKQIPGKHSQMKIQLNSKVRSSKAIHDVFINLSSIEFLKKCARGGTQNANESIHASIWNQCPKNKFAQKDKIERATAMAVSEFNMGKEATLRLLESLDGKNPTENQIEITQQADKNRIIQSQKNSKRKSTDKKTLVKRTPSLYVRGGDDL